MPAIARFILHNIKNDYADIELKYLCLDGKYFRRSMRQKIKVSNWDVGKERMKPGAKDSVSINSLLDSKEKHLYDSVRTLMEKSVRVTRSSLKSQMKGEAQTFWEFFDRIISDPPPSIGKNTLKDYRRNKNILKRFQLKFGEISFHSIDQNFADQLTTFMRTEPYGFTKEGVPKYYNDSTIQTSFRKIRALVNRALTYKVIVRSEKFSTSARGIDPGEIYLNDDEIKRIYEVCKNGLNEKGNSATLQVYGKIFVLGTQIGVRVSDLGFSPENIFENDGRKFANLLNKKTASSIIVPLSSLAIEIAEGFKWKIPKFNETIMNRYIKIICEIAGINEPVVYRAIEGGRMVERKYLKYQVISSHTMRRSFCTNMFIANVPIPIIMQNSGHKTIASFMKYIRVDQMQSAKIMMGYLK